jgi:hypothetical protein
MIDDNKQQARIAHLSTTRWYWVYTSRLFSAYVPRLSFNSHPHDLDPSFSISFPEVWTPCSMPEPIRQSCLLFHEVGIEMVHPIGVCERLTGLELELRLGSKRWIACNHGVIMGKCVYLKVLWQCLLQNHDSRKDRFAGADKTWSWSAGDKGSYRLYSLGVMTTYKAYQLAHRVLCGPAMDTAWV